MRRNTIFIIFIFLVSFSINSYATNLDSGLVAYYPFNGNANDESLNGNNGLVIGATLTTDRYGVANSAYNFNGTSNYIEVSDAASLRPQRITLCGWYNTTSSSSVQTIFIKSVIPGNTNEQYFYGFNLTAIRNFSIKQNSNCQAAQGWQVCSSNSPLATNQWQFFACTFDGTTMKIYRNDTLIAQLNPPNNIIDNCVGGKLYIGSYKLDGFFNGKLDDLRIYNRALSQTEVTALYNLINTKPVLLSPSNNSINVGLTPTLFWNSIPGSTSYKVLVSSMITFGNIIDSVTVSTNQRTIPIGKLNLASTYYWKVLANNQYGSSPWSEVWNFSTVITNITKIGFEIPNVFKMYDNYPNPFNPSTTIKFQIKDLQFTTLKIYDIIGKEIETLVSEKLSPGTYSVNWNASQFPSGIYLYTIQSGDFVETKRMTLIK